eukprot:gene44611-55511_t
MSSTTNLPFHSLSLLLVTITAALVYTNYSVARPDVNEHTALQASHGIHRYEAPVPDKTLDSQTNRILRAPLRPLRRGLGKNMAIALAKKGIDIILTYNSNKEEADKTVAEIRALGQQAEAYRLDAGNIKSFDAFLAEVTGHLKQYTGSTNFDFLINNAGTALYAPFAETTEEQFDSVLNIHYKGVFFLTQKAL